MPQSDDDYCIINGPTFRYFEWWRQVPGVDLGLTLTLADGINPAALRAGDQVNVVAAITNRGTLASTNPITLTVRVPAGIVPARVQASSTIQSVFQGFFDWLIGTPSPDPAVQRVDNADGSVSFTYPFTVGSLAPGETDRFEFTLTVTGQQAGEFFIDGQAQTTFDQTSPSPDGPDGVSGLTNVTTSALLSVQFVLEPPVGANVICTTGNIPGPNLWSRPDGDHIPLGNFQNVTANVYGWTPDGVPNDPNHAWWLFVQVIDNAGNLGKFGWMGGSLFPAPSPGQVCGEERPVPQFGYDTSNGNPISLVPTPTPMLIPTVTPNVTATPTIPATLYPTLTPGTPSEPPIDICFGSAEWLRNLCRQGWNYLTEEQQDSLTERIAGGLSPNFILLDEWWLENIRRGIIDVPPQVWQTDSFNQCAGNTSCRDSVQDAIFLFENMWRIGVDWANDGEGQILYDENRGALLENQELWYLADSDMSTTRNLNEYWGWLQDDGRSIDEWGFACDNFEKLGFLIPSGFDSSADVCWVCQDLPTLLYLRRGLSLQNEMDIYIPNRASIYNEAYYRYVPAVVNYAYRYDRSRLFAGNNPNYRIGEMVFTAQDVIPEYLISGQMGEQIDSPVFERFNHVGVVVRGSTLNMTLQQALDYVLIAQISYSSQGYFASSFDPGNLNISPDNEGGRYEVITLRTYLTKHLLGTNPALATASQVLDNGILEDRARRFLLHWGPSFIGSQ